jgi:hypothetical protein
MCCSTKVPSMVNQRITGMTRPHCSTFSMVEQSRLTHGLFLLPSFSMLTGGSLWAEGLFSMSDIGVGELGSNKEHIPSSNNITYESKWVRGTIRVTRGDSIWLGRLQIRVSKNLLHPQPKASASSISATNLPTCSEILSRWTLLCSQLTAKSCYTSSIKAAMSCPLIRPRWS